MKNETNTNTEPANSRNTLLCEGRANSELDSKSESTEVKIMAAVSKEMSMSDVEYAKWLEKDGINPEATYWSDGKSLSGREFIVYLVNKRNEWRLKGGGVLSVNFTVPDSFLERSVNK